jgi:hypothetical protein
MTSPPETALLHGEETVVYLGSGYQIIKKGPDMCDRHNIYRIVMRPGKRRMLSGHHRLVCSI